MVSKHHRQFLKKESKLQNYCKNWRKTATRARYGMEWKTIFPHSTLAIFFHSIFILEIFHSILKFPSIFHSILSYQGKFIPKATSNLYCTFATLNVPLKVVARESKHGTMHFIPYSKHYRNEIPLKFTQYENINHLINKQ